MVEHPHYDEIIDPDTYNRTIAQHLYIPESDQDIKEILMQDVQNRDLSEVLEAGCGPGRVTGMIGEIPNIHLTAIDISPTFLEYARNIDSIKRNTRIRIVQADFETYRHPSELDIVFSQGVHHHIEKGEKSKAYLTNLRTQLKSAGMYLLGDEFLPEYNDEQERRVRAVIWYSHIIGNAKQSKYGKLALEEAKTLLDDLNEGAEEQSEKSAEQIRLVMHSVENINSSAVSGEIIHAEVLAQEFLRELANLQTVKQTTDTELAKSRGDFKICESVLCAEMARAGFSIEGRRVQGPLATIGAMAVYTLRPILKKVFA